MKKDGKNNEDFWEFCEELYEEKELTCKICGKKFYGESFLVEKELELHISEAHEGINLGKEEKEAFEIAMKLPKKLLYALKDEENIKKFLAVLEEK